MGGSVWPRTAMGADRILLLTEPSSLRVCANNESCMGPKLRSKRASAQSESTNRTRFYTHSHTMIGFVLGFLMAYSTLIFYDRHLFACDDAVRLTSTNVLAMVQNTASSQLLDVAAVLAEEVRVLCMVLTCPKYHQERAAHVRATWGRRCNKLVFISSETDEELGAVAAVDEADDNYLDLWNKTRAGFRYIYENYIDDYDWFIKTDDDTYVIVENLRYMLYGYYPETPIYFGHTLIYSNTSYMSGGAGYVLSREALRRLIVQGVDDDSVCTCPNKFPEDFCMGTCMQTVGVYLADSRDAVPDDPTQKFFPLDWLAFVGLDPNKTISEWVMTKSMHPSDTGLNCCSNYAVTSHYVVPSHLYFYELLLYQMKVFGVQSPTAKLPQKMSTEEVAQHLASYN